MQWCDEYRMWVQEIEEKTGSKCPAVVFGEGCSKCQNLKIISGGNKK